MHAKSLQSCPTLCDPIEGSPPGSPVPGILQARTLEWLAISFSKAWKWKVKVKSLSHVRLLATPWTAAYQAPPSMGFSRQEYWRGVPLPSLDKWLRTPQRWNEILRVEMHSRIDMARMHHQYILVRKLPEGKKKERVGRITFPAHETIDDRRSRQSEWRAPLIHHRSTSIRKQGQISPRRKGILDLASLKVCLERVIFFFPKKLHQIPVLNNVKFQPYN